MNPTSYIEISKSAYQHNLVFLKNLIKDDTVFSSVVKGNAYGHGIEEFVPMACACGVNHYSVFSADEAWRVKKVVSDNTTIMILGELVEDQIEWAIENNIEFYVFNLERLSKTIELSKKVGKKARVHLELETGMNRTGFSRKTFSDVYSIVKANQELIKWVGLCTHFAGSESIANYYRVKAQISVFQKLAGKVKRKGFVPDYMHTACSAASIRYPKTQMDMVRIGILQYGFFPSREILIDYLTKKKLNEYPLKRLISWKSRVMTVKNVRASEFVGYGNSYLANTDMKVAVVPVGYAHGFTRSLSNRGNVLIGGHRLRVVGTVNMNMLTVDITEAGNVQVGDEAVLIGYQGDQEISVGSFGDTSEQINYELLTRLPGNIPRRIVD